MPPDTFFVDEQKARKTLADYKLIYESEEPIELASLIRSQQMRSDAAKPDGIATPDKPKKAVVPSDVDTLIPSGKPAGRYDIAVVIGNANYAASDTFNVDHALQDAQTMRQYLTKTFGYDPANIIYVENATLANMYEIFGTEGNYQGKLFKWVKPGQSKIFIYYVGHGAPDQQSGEGYFVPVDANPQYISTSGYKLSTFYENLSKIPAAKKTVVIDACFSGSSANGQLLKGVSGLTARLKAETKATVAADLLLTSAGMDQVASWYPEKGHSLFTYFFLKGIQGAADVNKDGSITMGEMRAWLNDQVPYMARRLTGNEQQPVIIGKDEDELVSRH
ncbi:MAG: caspase family protein [Trichlorobacter sp.]